MKKSLGKKITIFVLCLLVIPVALFYCGVLGWKMGPRGSVRYAIATANSEMLRKAISKDVTQIDSFRLYGKDMLTTAINWKRLSGRDALRNMTPEDVEEWKQKAFELVSVLLEFDVDVNSENGRALNNAIELRMPNVVGLLLENGANPDHVFPSIIPLDDPAMTAILLEYGVDAENN